MRGGVISILLVIGVAYLFLCVGAIADQRAEDEALQAAGTWLALIDGGQYSESWESASQLFRNAVEKEQWRRVLTGVRAPLGRLITRRVRSTQYTTSLPGAPDGNYVVIQYESSFENKKAVVETVTPMIDRDGTWRVSGYYIK